MIVMSKKYRGFLMTELVTSLALIGILLACLAFSLDAFRKLNGYQLTKQQCIAAAQAQLDSIAVTGTKISDEDFKRLWPKLTVSIEKSDGTGQWNLLKLVKVKTKARSYRRDVTIELARYIPAEGEI